MATANIAYQGEGTAITCSLASLADGGYQCSAAVTNDGAGEFYIDALVTGSVQVGAVTADGTFSIFAYGSADGGTTYSGGLAGANETITWGTTPSTSSVEGFHNLRLISVVSVDTTDDNNDIEFGPFSIASAFGGTMPADWGVVVHNETGVAFHATGTNNQIKYTGIEYTSA